MKNSLTLFLLFFAFHAVGQNAAISLNSFKKAHLKMCDGSSAEGFARFNLFNNLVFKAGDDAEKGVLDKETVARIILFSNKGEETIYDYKKVEKKSKIVTVMLQLLQEGSINLYQTQHKISGMGMGAGIPVQQTVYYFSRNAENTAIKIDYSGTSSRKFRKFAKEFFGDCPPLISKLNNNEFRRVGIREVIAFYNFNCGKAKN